MKKLLVFYLSLLVGTVQAQDFTIKPNGNVSEITVVIQNLFSDIEVRGTSEGEIKIQAIDYEGIPEKAKGLKPLSATGEDNTDIGLYVNQEGNEIEISGAHRGADDAEYVFLLPKNIKLKIDYKSYRAGDIEIYKMTNEVELKTQNSDILIEDVTGPIIAHSLSSEIEVIFSELSQSTPTSLTSTSGDIDITLPSSSKGNFKMSSTSGEVYTDLDFEFDEGKSSMKRWGGGMSAKATLNGGGVEVTMRSVSGDIFVRKSK